MKNLIAIISGEPNSINSEIISKVWKNLNKNLKKKIFVIGNPPPHFGGRYWVILKITTDKVQFNVDAKVDSDNARDLGSGGARWKDLYLSGGAYIGGTGAANHLDDYETGTFQMSVAGVSGGARGSGTNDKAGSILNLLRWVSPRTIKETFNPSTDYRYPFLEK